MIRRPPRSTRVRSSAASDVYKRQPLQWDKISPANYKLWNGYIDYDQTIANSKKRMANSAQIKLIEENAKWLKSKQDETTISLNYDTYKNDEEKAKKKSDYFKTIGEYDSKLSFESLKYEEELFTKDSVLREKRDTWHKNLAKDVYVEEAVNVLQDLKNNSLEHGKLAVKGLS